MLCSHSLSWITYCTKPKPWRVHHILYKTKAVKSTSLETQLCRNITFSDIVNQHSHEYTKFPNQNLRKIGQRVHEFGSDIQTNRDNYFLFIDYYEILAWEPSAAHFSQNFSRCLHTGKLNFRYFKSTHSTY